MINGWNWCRISLRAFTHIKYWKWLWLFHDSRSMLYLLYYVHKRRIKFKNIRYYCIIVGLTHLRTVNDIIFLWTMCVSQDSAEIQTKKRERKRVVENVQCIFQPLQCSFSPLSRNMDPRGRKFSIKEQQLCRHSNTLIHRRICSCFKKRAKQYHTRHSFWDKHPHWAPHKHTI